jgi:hypothetical protein
VRVRAGLNANTISSERNSSKYFLRVDFQIAGSIFEACYGTQRAEVIEEPRGAGRHVMSTAAFFFEVLRQLAGAALPARSRSLGFRLNAINTACPDFLAR